MQPSRRLTKRHRRRNGLGVLPWMRLGVCHYPASVEGESVRLLLSSLPLSYLTPPFHGALVCNSPPSSHHILFYTHDACFLKQPISGVLSLLITTSTAVIRNMTNHDSNISISAQIPKAEDLLPSLIPHPVCTVPFSEGHQQPAIGIGLWYGSRTTRQRCGVGSALLIQR